MLKSKAALAGFCTLVCSIGLGAQNCQLALRGYVREEGSEAPLAYASVFVREASKLATTDEKGFFMLSNLCRATKYTIEVRHLECDHLTELVYLEENMELCFHLHHDNTLNEVLIHAKAIAPRSTLAEIKVNQVDLEAGRGLNLGETLKKVPGVSLLNTGATISKPVIQGLHSNRIAIVNNGVALESQQWGTEHAPEIDPFGAEKISVVKGAAGVRYGVGAMAGAIILEPTPLRSTAGLGGWFTVGSYSNGRRGVTAGAMDWHLPEQNLSLRIQGSMKRSGNLRTPDYYLGNTGSSEMNLSGMAEWSSKRWRHECSASQFSQRIAILRAAHTGNLTDLQRAIESPMPLNNQDWFSFEINRPYQNVRHLTLKYKTEFRISNLWKASAQYSFQFNSRREYDIVRKTGSASDKAQVAFRLWSNVIDAAIEHFPIHNWRGGAGIQLTQQTNFVSRGGFIPDYHSFGGGVWAMERWRRLHNPWELEVGARYDFRQSAAVTNGSLVNLDTTVRFGNASATIGLLYHAGEKWVFSVNTGQAWRPPHVNELFARGVHHGAGTYEQGTPTLLPEKAWNSNINARYDHGQWQASVTLYRNAVRQFIYLNPGLNTVLTVRGAFPAYYYQQAERAVLQGLDGNFSVPIVPWLSLEGGVSLLRGKRVFKNEAVESEWLPLMPSDRLLYGIRCDIVGRTNNQQTSATEREKRRKTFIRISGISVRRQSRIPAEGLLKNAPDGYTVFSLDAMHTLYMFKRNNPLEIGLGIQNLSNTRYREYLNFFRYYADEPGLNLGLRAKLVF